MMTTLIVSCSAFACLHEAAVGLQNLVSRRCSILGQSVYDPFYNRAAGPSSTAAVSLTPGMSVGHVVPSSSIARPEGCKARARLPPALPATTARSIASNKGSFRRDLHILESKSSDSYLISSRSVPLLRLPSGIACRWFAITLTRDPVTSSGSETEFCKLCQP